MEKCNNSLISQTQTKKDKLTLTSPFSDSQTCSLFSVQTETPSPPFATSNPITWGDRNKDEIFLRTGIMYSPQRLL